MRRNSFAPARTARTAGSTRRLPRAATWASALGGLLLVLAPLVLGDSDTSVLVATFTVAVAALGLDLLVGRTGQLSLAHAAYLGVGFFAAVRTSAAGYPWPASVLAAIVVTSLMATLAGLPSLRIRGLQVAITTLAFQIAAERYLFRQPWFAGEDVELVRPGFLENPSHRYWFSLGALGLVVLLLRRVGATRTGRSFIAVRDVEARAVAFGVQPGPTKLLAYATSGAITGLGGALFAFDVRSVSNVDAFNLRASLLLVAVAVVGGAGSYAGILLGAIAVYAMPTLLSGRVGFADYLPIVFAAGLVASVVLAPEGIGGSLRLAGRLIDGALLGRPERPSPRPIATDPVAGAAKAAALRDVPRPLAARLPVPALLVAEGVTVQYGGVRALADLDLEVRRGEVVGLIGANGAGKSTFFNAVSGLAPVTGSIRYRGRQLVGSAPSDRTGSGLARTFQDMGLVRAQSVRENLLLSQGWLATYAPAAGLLGLGSSVRTERDLRVRADAALELFGLAHLADERLGDLPYGTMRIVEIAAAVAAGPELLLLDEASAGLTPEEAHQLGDRFLALRDELGLTLVVIEHHVPLVARVCDWCYVLESGALIATGPPTEVTAQPRVIESFLGKGSLAAGRTA